MIEETSNNPSLVKPDERAVSAAASSVGLGKGVEESDKTKYAGTDRIPYLLSVAILVCLAFCCLQNSSQYSLLVQLRGLELPAIAMEVIRDIALWVIFLFFVGLSISRLKNVGWPWYVFFTVLVPVLNLWTSWVLFVCPSGYRVGGKLGLSGWIASVVFGVLVLALVGMWWMFSR